MKRMPFVSIIINNYNYEKFLNYSIESSLNQVYESLEVIVVDDGSTDSSRQIIESYGDRIFPIFQENGKQGSALNAGFANSNGELILFLDADDYLLPHAVETIVQQWNPSIAKIHFRLNVVDAEQQALGYSIPSEKFSLASGDVCSELLRSSGYVSTPMSGNAYHRSTLEKILPIPAEYSTTADDYLMISAPFCGTLHGIEEALGCYRIHNDNQWALTSISGSRFRRFVKHDLQNFSLLQERASARGLKIAPDLEMRSIGRIWSRIASLRLEPEEHPVPNDSILRLIYFGLRALWYYSDHNVPKRLIYSFFIFWVGIMPRSQVQIAYTWLYAPHLRSVKVNKVLNFLRSIVSS